MNKKHYYTMKDVAEAVKNSKSIAGVCRYLKIPPHSSNHFTIKKKVQEYGLDTSHFTGQLWSKGLHCTPHYKQPLEALLVKDSSSTNKQILKKRLFAEGLKEHVCEGCGLTEWLGKPINLELHHINGHPTDNRLENLQMLCPNCHSYTDNYCSKNRNNKDVESVDERDKVTESDYELTFEVMTQPLKKEQTVIKPKRVVRDSVRYCLGCGKEFRGKRTVYCSEECYMSCKKSKRPPVFELLNSFKKYNSYLAVGKHYGVTGSAVKKWVKLYRIEDIIKDVVRGVNKDNIEPV